MSSGRGVGPTATGFAEMRQAEREGALIVAPDRARVEISVSTLMDGSRAKAEATIDDWLKRFVSSVDNVPGCDATVAHRSVSTKRGETQAAAGATVVVEVALQGLSTMNDRWKKLSQCAHVVEGIVGQSRNNSKMRSTGTFARQLRGWTIGVDNPRSHLPKLLTAVSDRFRAMAAKPYAPQLRLEDRRCVPTGEVVIRSATIAGVWLEADLDCDVNRIPSGHQQTHAP